MKLVEKMYIAFDRSKLNLNCALFCSLFVLVLSLLQVFRIIEIGPLLVSFVIFGFQISSYILRNVFLSTNYSLGEKIRRVYMLKDGLGINPSEGDLATIQYELENELPRKVNISEVYYESKSKAGPQRLVENVRESSFFTFKLSNVAGTLFFGITILGVILSIVGYVLLVNEASSDSVLPISRAFILGLTFWVCGDLLSLAIKYNKTFRSAENIFNKSSELLKHPELSEHDSLVLFGEYNCVMISANPIPNWIFRAKQSRLNKAWSSRKIAT